MRSRGGTATGAGPYSAYPVLAAEVRNLILGAKMTASAAADKAAVA